ncbi:MAG: YeeE/YedE family protein [Nitriliruptorales bacterium]|nr:YeeE/YedE family protein [Nitriliruptorales bacterium]
MSVGVVFGAALFLTGMADYDVIHDGLLFRHAHLYLMMVATLGVGIPLLWLLGRGAWRSAVNGPVAVTREAVQRKHVSGGLIFGTGWAIAGTCPGAVAAMAASGKPLALITMAGVGIGVVLRDLQEERTSQRQSEPVDVPAVAVPPV